MEWFLNPLETKLTSSILILFLFATTLWAKKLTLFSYLNGFFFFIISIPLGHDSLNYINIYEAGNLNRYGPIWSLLSNGSDYTESWLFFYVLAFIAITTSFYLLSRRSSYPTLFFAMLVTLPGIGLDFISIIRQGLATAFVIYGYLLISKKMPIHSVLSFIASFLVHSSSILISASIVIRHTIIRIGAFKLFLLTLISSLISIILFREYSFTFIDDAISNQLPYFFLTYIYNRDNSTDSGRMILVFWFFIAYSPWLLNIVFTGKFQVSRLNYHTIYMIFYVALFAVSAPLARLAWYFLPFILLSSFELIDNNNKFSKLMLLTIGALSLLTGLYGISIAPTFFWLGQYD